MAELQIPDYMINKPESVADLVSIAINNQGQLQAQKLNQMKMDEYQQDEPIRNRLKQAQAEDEYATATLKKQKIIGGLASNVLSQLDKSNIADPNQRQQFITQAIDAHKPYLQNVLQIPVNDYLNEQQLRSLAQAAKTNGEYHPPVPTSEGYLQFDNGQFAPMLNAQGKPYMPGAVDVGNKFDIGMANALSSLVQAGHIPLEKAQAIMQSQVMNQQAPQQQIPQQQRQPQRQPQVFIDPNMSSEDQALANQDLWNTYESNVADQAKQYEQKYGIPSNAERKQEEVDIQNKGKSFEREEALASKYQNQSKAFRELSEAYQKTKNLFDKAQGSAPATLAAATAYMKLLDPGSVVRESELGMALNATGKLDKAENFMNRINKGEVLTESQVKQFKDATEEVYKAATKQQRIIDKNYSDTASRNKLNPKNIIQDVGQYGSYKNPEEVKASVANGDLEIDDAKDILRNKFGME